VEQPRALRDSQPNRHGAWAFIARHCGAQKLSM